MSAVAHFIAYTLTGLAALITLAAALFATQGESINLYGYLIPLGSLLLAILTGIGLPAVLGFFLFNLLLTGILMFIAALAKHSAEEGVPVTQLIRQIWAERRAQRNPPTFQDTDTDTDKPVDEITIFKNQR